MINFTIAIIGTIMAMIHVFMMRNKLDKGKLVQIALLYYMIFGVFFPGFIAFVGHVFFSDIIAPKIGWAPSPFETEVGLHDGAWALIALLAVWVRGTFCHAVIIGWSFFIIGAGINHGIESVSKGNFAEYNYLMIFFDIGIGLVGLFIWWFWMKFNNIRFLHKE